MLQRIKEKGKARESKLFPVNNLFFLYIKKHHLLPISFVCASSEIASSLPSRDFQEGAVEPENVLQKHVAFFDRNHDGLVYPWETFAGFRAIGAGYLLSLISFFFINVALSRKTRPGMCVCCH